MFNAHHSPIGAFASFTLGYPGAKGGFGLELGKPADQSVYIGLESDTTGLYEALPFFAGSADEERKRYEVEGADEQTGSRIVPFASDKVTRDFHLSTDAWNAGRLRFEIFSPVRSVPDPAVSNEAELKEALLPAVLAELTIDNRDSDRPRRAFVGYTGSDPYSGMRRMDDTSAGSFIGVGQGRNTALVSRDDETVAALGFSMESILDCSVPENLAFALGNCGAILLNVPAGERRVYRFALCFYKGGLVTTGMDCSYLYTDLFPNIESVGAYALDNYHTLRQAAISANDLVDQSALSEDRRFMLAHAIRSYYGSTQLLKKGDEPFWVVNEGEYRMMNTFDLTVDHLYFEMRMNPWTVQNSLDMFAERYCYRDDARFPGDDHLYPGGISFTHDMGVNNQLSRPGHSAYEQYALDDCFSHMTHEQLVNWTLCGLVYIAKSENIDWALRRLPIFEECFTSMLNRDNPDPEMRNGVMSLDSSRTMGGAEITTYDSLDQSLGQARHNIYLASKCWAAYVGLETFFAKQGRKDLSSKAAKQADLCAVTLISHQKEDGFIPAVLGENEISRIIPAVEGLVFPEMMGCPEMLSSDGRFGDFICALRKHLIAILKPGVCLFDDGGWKLSSTSDNSWLSKIYLCQYIARNVLKLYDPDGEALADSAHVDWLLHPVESYWAWSDQMVSGEAKGSKYYPRGVTAILWLNE